MCIDLEAAKRNRKMVKQKLNIDGYVFIENLVKAWPRSKPLPNVAYKNGQFRTVLIGGSNLYGNLPSLDKSERGNMESQGICEIGNDGLLEVNYETES